MEIKEFICGQRHQGISNILINIFLLLFVNIETEFNGKIIVYFREERNDFILNFCNVINNKKLEFRKCSEYKKKKKLPTLKSNTKVIYHKINEIMSNKNKKELYTDVKFGIGTFIEKKMILESFKYFPFQVNESVQNKIHAIQKKIGKYIAIHVRTTDFPDYKKFEQNGKIEQYFTPYCNFVDKYHDYNIYISTDSSKSQRFFLEKYKKRIFYYQKISDTLLYKKRFVSGESVYIDYFCCRDAKYFMPTKNSTFSDFIHLLRFLKDNS